LQLSGDNSDHEITPFAVEELWATPTGQVGTSLKGETVFSLNQKYFKKSEIPQNELKGKITELSGIKFDRKLSAAVFTGKIMNDDFEVKKFFLENDKKDFALPVYVISKPVSPQTKNLVWLKQNGKEQTLNSTLLTDLLNDGYTVISADLPGIGELFDPGFRGDGFVQKVPFNYTFGANVAGKSISGIQAEALNLLVQFIQKDFPDTKTDILSEENMESAVLHYTVLKNPFSKVVLINPHQANIELIKTEYYNPQRAYNVVPGSLSFYDLQDMIKLLPANSVKKVNALNEENKIEIINFLK
jgi:hypothetical protein